MKRAIEATILGQQSTVKGLFCCSENMYHKCFPLANCDSYTKILKLKNYFDHLYLNFNYHSWESHTGATRSEKNRRLSTSLFSGRKALLSDVEWAWKAKKACIVASVTGNTPSVHCSIQRDELGQPKTIPFKLINQSSILSIRRLKPRHAGKVCTTQKHTDNKWLETGLQSLPPQACSGVTAKDAVSLLDTVVLETPEHTALMTKKTKSWMHFLRLLVSSLSQRVYGGGPPWDGYAKNAGNPHCTVGPKAVLGCLAWQSAHLQASHSSAPELSPSTPNHLQQMPSGLII